MSAGSLPAGPTKTKSQKSMDNKVEKIQSMILVGFIAFYGISLAVNAVMAIAGKENLAVWHWPLFYLSAKLAGSQIPDGVRKRVAETARNIVKGVALSMVRVVRRAVRNLAALFIKSRTTQAREA